MDLNRLAEAIGVAGQPSVEILDLAYDPRAVTQGSLFFCIVGSRAGGKGPHLVARDEDPAFTEDDVLNLARVGQEAAPLLSAALDTRALARALAELSDVSESTDPSDFPGGSAPDRPLTAPE